MDPITHTQAAPKPTVQGRRGYACTFCRRRKFKCDGRNPCRSCIKGKQTCSYDNTSHRTPTQLLQDRIDELQSKIASIESRGKSPRSPTIRRSVPSQKQFSPNGYIDGPYVFSSNEYPAGPSRSLFASASNQPYVADYVPSECSSSSSNNLDFGFGNYAPNSITDPSTCRNSPTIASWEPQPPAFEIGSPQILDSQATQMLGSDGTIPAPLAEKITFHFMTHRFRTGLLNIGRTQPQNLNSQRHPALLSVCYLVGCFFCPDGSLEHLEPTFVERTRRALEDAIDLTQDPSYATDYLLASSSLAQYLYTKGRLLEGYHRAISAIRFAVNHGFHKIKPLSQDVLSMQNPARAQALLEQQDRIRVWWHTWCIDRWGSLLTGLPCGIADADIQTPWPLPDDLIDPTHAESVMSLYSPDAEMPVLTLDPGYANGYKAMALLERASVKASSAHTVAPEVWAAEHSVMQSAIARFAATLDVHTQGVDVESGTVLAIVHTMVYAATCALHMPYIRQWRHDENLTAQRNHLRMICREGAATAVAILKNLTVSTYLVSALQGLPLAALCEFLLQERDDLIDELDFTEQAEVDKQLDEMMNWMHEMESTFPVLGMQVEKLEARRR